MTPITRRTFLGGVAAGIAATQLKAEALGPVLRGRAQVPAAPFTLGVASGDPVADGVVLWTRLAPDPLNGGGMPPGDLPVAWEVAADEGFGSVVAQGTSTAVAALAHSVHAEVSGLAPDSRYFYRFSADGFDSPVGQARTTPPGGSLTPLRFGFASCQRWTSGYYNAHAALAQEGCDLIFFLGDYIYEGGGGSLGARPHNSDEVITLVEYRNRYGLYKGDLDLQAAQHSCSWAVIWDDHEVDNNYAGLVPDEDAPAVDFAARRAAAYQAWWEHQPVRLSPPTGPDLTIYRQQAWGALANFHMIDTRQYRSDQACGDELAAPCPGWDDPARTMLGSTQESWLFDGLRSSSSVWNVLANQVVFSPLIIGSLRNMDQWDGYPAQQQRAWDVLQTIRNPVVITGDIHAAGAGRLHQNLTDVDTPALGYELVGTGISSKFDPRLADAAEQVFGNLPWLDYANVRDQGYVVVDLSSESLAARYRVVSTVDEPGATVSTDFSLELPARAANEPIPPGTVPDQPPVAPGPGPTESPGPTGPDAVPTAPTSPGAAGPAPAAPAAPVPATPTFTG